MALDLWTSAVGLPLAFFLPGFAVGAAVFPEKLRRAAGWDGPVELVVLGVIGSTAITILIGSALTAVPAGLGIGAADPSLWLADAAVAAGGAGIWFLRRNAPGPTPSPEAEDAAAWPTLRTLERLAEDERRLQRTLRTPDLTEGERGRLQAELGRLRGERDDLRRATEGRHAS